MPLRHLAVCVVMNGKRVGSVVSAASWEKAVDVAERHDNRVGYVCAESFSVAVTKALSLERGSPKLQWPGLR